MQVSLATIAVLIFQTTAQQGYIIDSQQNCNNVYDAVSDVSKSNQWVTFLGVINPPSTAQDCIDLCLNASTASNRCQSYTFYTWYFEEPYKSHCYGRFGEPYGILWTPVQQNYVDCGRIIYPCTNDINCSLNGICNVNTGNCTCRAGWTGYHCDKLNLLPATKTAGYHITNTSSWGGSVLFNTLNTSDKQTKYHMYLSQFDNHCGVDSWSLNSVLIHAQSTAGFNSAYKPIETLHSNFAHEPDVIEGPNGEIVLYYSAFNYSDIKECECSDGSTNPSCKVPPAQFINIMQYAEQNNLSGPWKRSVIFPDRSTNDIDTNLAGIILSNGTFIGMMRIWTDGSEIHLVTSNDWKNGSQYQINENKLFPQLVPLLTEDPFIYRDCNNYLHAIFHNMSPDVLPIVCGAHAYSVDGITWIYRGISYENTVEFVDGTSFTFSRRERPHFIFADDKCTPIALTNGVQYGGEYGDGTYTLLQPINH
eukprot:296292_1